MAGFSMKERQAIIDGYLNATGRNEFQPAEFIDWLERNPEHQAYEWFFGMDDAAAAREHRIAMARSMANGLRIVVAVKDTIKTALTTNVRVAEAREFPAMISPVAGRTSGGGYVQFNPDDAGMMSELRRQGAVAMRAWLNRYRGAFEAVDLSTLEKIAASQDGGVSDAA
jgi:hypothetical protein